MVLAEKHAKTCGYIARARAPHAHVREENAQKRVENAPLRVKNAHLRVVNRGRFAAFSGQKKTPCKRVARGVCQTREFLFNWRIPRTRNKALSRLSYVCVRLESRLSSSSTIRPGRQSDLWGHSSTWLQRHLSHIVRLFCRHEPRHIPVSLSYSRTIDHTDA